MTDEGIGGAHKWDVLQDSFLEKADSVSDSEDWQAREGSEISLDASASSMDSES